MKKVIKISLVAVAALLFFLNVSLTMNDNKVEALNVKAEVKIAQADTECHYSEMYNNCYCITMGAECHAFCYDFCAGGIVEGK